MSEWKPIATAPAGDAVLIRNDYSWTLGRFIAREVQTLQFGWPPIKYESKWGWVYAYSRVQPVDFVPTEWSRVDHGGRKF